MNIDLRNEFDILLSDYALDVLLISNTKYVKCKCYNELYNSGNPECNICFGTGKVTKIKKIKTILKDNTIENIFTDLKNNINGQIATDTMSLYCKYNVDVKINDTIVLCGFNKKGEPINVVKVLEVKSIKEIIGDRGRTELQVLYTKTNNTKITEIQKSLKALDIKARKVISNGGQYLWPMI